jgi:8-oxo-dGTP pyrophosphatase MutT (NUDIX family)
MMDVDNKVLLNKRADKMKLFPKGWVLPGGHLELGETIDIAALRELEEECGV